jgi:preprotein translocase subunit SecE
MAENVKVSKFDNTRKKIVRFFRDMKSELKKVIWPTKEQLVKSTITVLLICLAMGIIIWISDAILSRVLRWVLSI